jgi:hypothetical protein
MPVIWKQCLELYFYIVLWNDKLMGRSGFSTSECKMPF